MLSENATKQKLNRINISMKGKYINESLTLKLKCEKCNFQWLGTPITAIKLGCPKCKQTKN